MTDESGDESDQIVIEDHTTEDPESDGGFDEEAEGFLREMFPDATLERQVYIPEPYRFVDFTVTYSTPEENPDVTLVVETEDTFKGVVGSVGQVQMYAGFFERGIPVIVYPEDHAEEPEMSSLRMQSPVTFLEVPSDGSSQ